MKRVGLLILVVSLLTFSAFAKEETSSPYAGSQVIYGKDGTTLEPMAPPAQTPTVYVVTLTSADTEYSFTLPANTKKFTIQTRESADVRIATETGKVATSTDPYFTLKAGNIWWEDGLNTSATLYFASSTAGVHVEIIVWK